MASPAYDTVVRGRRSIRGFLDRPVARDVIAEVLELAMRAPSSLNTQPWNFYVVTGEPLDRIRAGNVERNLAGLPPSRELRAMNEYEGVHRA
ncbi:MAG TPA: nitroreductase family protein, partial [Novosphingobium sp.]